MARPMIYTESSYLQSRTGGACAPNPAPDKKYVRARLEPAPTLAYEATLVVGTFVGALSILDRQLDRKHTPDAGFVADIDGPAVRRSG